MCLEQMQHTQITDEFTLFSRIYKIFKNIEDFTLENTGTNKQFLLHL